MLFFWLLTQDSSVKLYKSIVLKGEGKSQSAREVFLLILLFTIGRMTRQDCDCYKLSLDA